MAIQDQLLELERAGWDSLCRGTGAEFYGDTMTEDGRMVLANGMVMDRQMVVQSLAEAPTWDGYSIDEPEVIAVGEDVCVLVYTGTGRRDGAEDFVGIMTSVYVRRGHEWRLAFYQQTPKG